MSQKIKREMTFRINEKIFEQFPDLNIGLVIAKNINNKGEYDAILSLLKQAQEEVKANYNANDFAEDEQFKAWRTAYKSFGAKPKKHRCSVENLYRMILGGRELGHINTLVDLYNYLSIKHMAPVGGDDLNKTFGDIELTIAKGDERFVELGTTEIKYAEAKEVIYADDNEVLCRRWNWRECDKSKMTENTWNAALVVEGLPPTGKEKVQKMTEELAALVEKFCGGTTKVYIVNKSNPEIYFDFEMRTR